MKSNIIQFPNTETRQALKLQKEFERNHKLLTTYAAGYKVQVSPEERAKRIRQKQMSFGERYGINPKQLNW